MALSFRDEIEALIKHNLEQTEGWHLLTSGQSNALTQQKILTATTKMSGVHSDALLRVAEEIDKLKAALDGK